MTRMTAKDFPQELLALYDFHAHGRITRRQFLDRAAKFAVGGVTAAALLSALSPDYALAQQVSFTDPDILVSLRSDYALESTASDGAPSVKFWK